MELQSAIDLTAGGRLQLHLVAGIVGAKINITFVMYSSESLNNDMVSVHMYTRYGQHSAAVKRLLQNDNTWVRILLLPNGHWGPPYRR